jgi:hypothetical protein
MMAAALLGAEPSAVTWKRAPHPRLFADQKRLSELKEGFQTTFAPLWPTVEKRADAVAAKHPPAYPAGRDMSGEEQWWQMEVGSNLPYLALAYKVTGKAIYLDAAKEWTLASCGYPHWGLGSRDGGDLSAGFMLTGVAVVYDWLYNDLDPDTRATLRRTLMERGRLMYQQSKKIYWRDAYLQNHLWVSLAGLAASASALEDDAEMAEEAGIWMSVCLEKFRRTEALLGPDGASHEGVTYWTLGLDGLLRFWALANDLVGENLTSKWWANTGYYRLYMGLPRNAATVKNKVVDFADCTRSEWAGPQYLLRRLAAMYRDPYLERLADETAPISNCDQFGSCWLDMIWYDPSIRPKALTTLPTMRHFEDMGIVSARTDWSGDESLLAFKCGPGLGHYATAHLEADAGGAHVHPDANHFVLFGDGEWLIRDDGYRMKGSVNHNTLLVEGKGQMGENSRGSSHEVYGAPIPPGMWFAADNEIRAKAHPRITAAQSTPAFDYMVGDATEAYPSELGLRRFVRQIVFLKPDVVIVADDVETDRPRSVELRFHPQFPSVADGAGAFLSRGRTSVLRVEPFPSDNVQVTAAYMPAKTMLTPARAEGLDKLEDPNQLYTIQLKTEKASWRSGVALSWSAAGKEPAKVRLETKGNVWIFHAGSRSILLKWDGSAAQMVAAKGDTR